MKLEKKLIEKIRKANGKENSEKIIRFFELVKKELIDFEFNPEKNPDIDSDSYNKAFSLAQKKLEKVGFRPFGIVGVGGSVLLEKGHDIDIFVFPKKGISSGLLLAAFNELRRMIKEKYESLYEERIIIFPFSAVQEEVEYLSKRKGGELFIHFVRICESFYGKNMGNPDGVKSWLPEFILFQEGKIVNDVKDSKLDRMFLGLDMLDLFDAEYPKILLSEKVHNFRYILKKLNINPDSFPMDDLRAAYQSICLLVDYFNVN